MGKKRLKVDLDEIVEAMDWGDEENRQYLDTETGQVHLVMDELYQAIEDEKPLDELPEWMMEFVPVARAVAANDPRYKYIEPIESFEAHKIMENFVYSGVEDEELREKLARAISGRGAFRCFKDALCDYPEVEKRWFEYDAGRKREMALEWLDSTGIEPE